MKMHEIDPNPEEKQEVEANVGRQFDAILRKHVTAGNMQANFVSLFTTASKFKEGKWSSIKIGLKAENTQNKSFVPWIW